MAEDKVSSRKIERLSELTSNQIAAGEVVQRPASVVKELIENAVDAGAKVIVLGIRDGGRSLIQVIDDGCGMSFDDAATAFERHATSKIRNSDDLSSLTTFGFRGEALPSIASVSEVTLKTMRKRDELGTQVSLSGGVITDHSMVSASVGTQFSIKNLFYNVPARRKFMKSAEVETRHIIAEFKKIALFYNNVSFMMHNNDRCVYSLPVTNLRARVTDVIGTKVNKELIEIYVDTPLVEVKGYVGRPNKARRSPEQYMFVNGRYFKSSYFNKAIISAYDNLLVSAEVSPQYFIYLSCDPSVIDVNIHPSKIEVKFENEEEIAQIIKAAIRASLGKNGIMPMIDFDDSSGIDIPIFGNAGVISRNEETNRIYNLDDSAFSFTDALFGSNIVDSDDESCKDLDEEFMAVELNKTLEKNSFEKSESLITSSVVFADETEKVEEKVVEHSIEELFESSFDLFEDKPVSPVIEIEKRVEEEVIHNFEEFIGHSDFEVESEFEISTTIEETPEKSIQTEIFSSEEVEVPIGETTLIDGKYILTTIGNDIYIVDSRRAMNRIMYDRCTKNISRNISMPSHKLLFPPTISLQPSDRLLVEECREDLRSMGFLLEESEQEGALDIMGIPVDMEQEDPYQLFEDILDSIKTDDNLGYNEDKRERLIKTISYISTNKKTNFLAKEEMVQIVKTLRSSDNFSYTPNGKPIIVKIGVNDIKKLLEKS